MRCEECEYYVPINNDDHGWCDGTFVEVYPEDECIWDEEEEEEDE